MECDVAIVGAGPAGMAAALSAYENGAEHIVLIDRNNHAGGILKQCIHDGFGLIRFRELLTGPEYAKRYVDMLNDTNVRVITGAMVTKITPSRDITYVARTGLMKLQAKAIVLATGCRERTRGAVSIPGARPAGIFTAGVAQYMANIQNIKPGKNAVVLGSGDIGLIMARRLTLEGMHVESVLEILPYCSGLPRNKSQCLDDYGIPLLLSTTVAEIRGQKRLEQIVAATVDENREIIPGSKREIDCDTLILSVGLIPENELARECGIIMDEVTGGCIVNDKLETSVSGIFACGNGLHVHDLVDHVSSEGELAGKGAALHSQGKSAGYAGAIDTVAGEGIRYVLPQKLSAGREHNVSVRVLSPHRDCQIDVLAGDELIKTEKLKRANPAEMLSIAIPQLCSSAEHVEVALSGS